MQKVRAAMLAATCAVAVVSAMTYVSAQGRQGNPGAEGRQGGPRGPRDRHLVYIATPPFLHHPQAMKALQTGKHVICEKPLALDVRQADEMIALAEEKGWDVDYYMCCLYYLTRPKDELHKLLEANA